MAVARPARSSPPFALIIITCLWFISMAVAVIFYIKLGQAQDDAVANSNALLQAASTNERNAASYKQLVEYAKGHPVEGGSISTYAQLDSQVNLLKKQFGGPTAATKTTDAVIADIHAAMAAAGRNEGEPVTDALHNLSAALAAEKANVETAKKSLADAQAAYEAAKAQYGTTNTSDKAAIQKAQADAAQAATSLADAQARVAATNQNYEKQLTDSARALEDSQRQLAVQKKQAKEDLDVAHQKIIDLQHTIDLLRPSLSTNAAAHEADGKIIRTTPGSADVWITLGRKDHVSPGLTFAVYDPRYGVGSGPNSGGKGGLEVVEVGDNESLCRVTHVEKGQTILQDDLIANAVYNKDKNRKYHFVVYGDFDLDGDGIATPGERDKLVRLIQGWGGVIDDKLTTQSDFIILGAQPGSASTKFDTVTEQTDDMKKARKGQQDDYNKMLSDARAYSIPVLDSTRFLAMIGYYATTVWK